MYSYTWDLENVFPDFNSLKKEFDLIENMINIFRKYDFFSSLNKENIILYFSSHELIERKIRKIYIFCSLCCDIDFNNIKYSNMKVKINNLYISFNNIAELHRRKFLSFAYKKIVKFTHDNNLNYDFEIEKIFDYKNEDLKKIKDKQVCRKNMSNAKNEYKKITNKLIFEPVLMNNEENPLTESNYSAYLDNYNKDVRKQAFVNYFNTIYKNRDNLYDVFKKYVISYSNLTKIDEYDSSLKKYCANNNFSYKLYNKIIDIINNNLSLLTNFFKIKKQILGINDFSYYDIFAPLKYCDNHSYEEGVVMISNSLSILGDEYSRILKKIFLDNWIDVYPKSNKRSGYYSVNSYDLKPYIFINFEGKYKDITILSHEIGHAIHSYFSNNCQPYQLSSTQNSLEISSLVNELLLGDYLITNAKNEYEKLSHINNLLSVYLICFYRYGMLAEFERDVHDFADKSECMGIDYISEYYYTLNKKYLGNLVSIDNFLKNEWLNIPHFYNDFYCYKYVIGISCATKIVDKLLKGDELYRKKYIDFLKAGCSNCINDLLKEIDVNINDSTLYLGTINKISELILQLKKHQNLKKYN